MGGTKPAAWQLQAGGVSKARRSFLRCEGVKPHLHPVLQELYQEDKPSENLALKNQQELTPGEPGHRKWRLCS